MNNQTKINPHKVENFTVGDEVVYLPPVSQGNENHPSAEYGTVVAKDTRKIMVLFEDRNSPVDVDPFKLRNLRLRKYNT